MKKHYISPETNVVQVMGNTLLIGTSIPVNDSENVINDDSDIGFTKENDGDWENIWD